LIECLIRPFDVKQGFCSIRNIKKSNVSQFPETIEVGGISKMDLMAMVSAAGCEFTSQTLSILRQEGFTTLPERKTVKLCRKTVADMGFTGEWTPWYKIREWIEEKGQLCDNELALQLRLDYQKQPVDEELYIANTFQFFRLSNIEGKMYIFRNGIDGFQSDTFLTSGSSAKEDATLYCLYNEFVYYEK
jgi:hypothetical protein